MAQVKGSLHRHLKWWKDNINNDYIVNVVESGYRLPLLEIPKDSYIRNNKSARDQESFVDDELNRLLLSGIIIKLSSKPTVVNALTVATNASGKHRLVLDMRHVNPLLNVPHYKYENIAIASSYFLKHGYMITYDLKSGYHHIDMHPAYVQYLGFAWKGVFYAYTTCPFGCSTSGLIFSKVLRELVKKWRSQGMALVMYLDDGFLTCPSAEETAQAAHIIKTDLMQAGFIINEQKSNWVPSQCVTWLGFVLNSKDNIFLMPEEKLLALKKKLSRNLYFASTCSAREVAKTVGSLCSMFHAFGPLVYFLTKDCTHWIEDRMNWTNRAPLSQLAINELQFWARNLYVVKPMPLVPDSARVLLIVYSDASAVGCGAFILEYREYDMMHHWTLDERSLSSTWREIRALVIFLKLHHNFFKDKSLKWYTDNQGVTTVVKKGSMKLDLHVCALEIFEVCLRNNIQLSVDWVPREQNKEADSLSRVEDPDDWGIDIRIFSAFNKSHGPFTVDVFASNITKQLPKFYSKYWCEGSAGVDAFAYSWKSENCWLVPPPGLIPRTLAHMKFSNAKGILVAPRWQSAVFWPLLHSGSSWNNGISLVHDYNRPSNFFKSCIYGNDVFSEKPFAGTIMILKIDFQV